MNKNSDFYNIYNILNFKSIYHPIYVHQENKNDINILNYIVGQH